MIGQSDVDLSSYYSPTQPQTILVFLYSPWEIWTATSPVALGPFLAHIARARHTRFFPIVYHSTRKPVDRNLAPLRADFF